jgi:hypothetical protein
MDFKGGSSQNSITNVQGIGKDWGSLRQHESPQVRRFKERHKEHRDPRQEPQHRQSVPAMGSVEKDQAKQEPKGFEIII